MGLLHECMQQPLFVRFKFKNAWSQGVTYSEQLFLPCPV